ncbi:MAG: c-type cytochrome [Gemmatimonadaceae bacterium]
MRTLSSLVILAAFAAACGGGEAKPEAAAAADAPAAPAAAASLDPATITPQMLALGDSLFHGLIGATSCQACHGADAAQGTVAPVLTDAEWLHSDGSWEGIYNTVKGGVSQPKKFTSMMPPDGGVPMTDDQRRAVTAYVYKLSHK